MSIVGPFPAQQLRYTLVSVHCVVGIASLPDDRPIEMMKWLTLAPAALAVFACAAFSACAQRGRGVAR
jgi:hypothetical protein